MKWSGPIGWGVVLGGSTLAALAAIGFSPLLSGDSSPEPWWEARQPGCAVTLALTDHKQAAQLAGNWLLQQQRPDGHFAAGHSPTAAPDPQLPSPIRQATAALALARWSRFGGGQRAYNGAAQAIEGWEYVDLGPDESLVVWPGADEGDSAVLALILLAHTELLRHPDSGSDPLLQARRDQLARASKRLVTANGRIHSGYDRSGDSSNKTPDALTDGAMLLAWYHTVSTGVPDLQSPTLGLAEATWLHNHTRPLQLEPDPLPTKSLFPWGLEALVELGASEWLDTEEQVHRAQTLSIWMIQDHQMLRRAGNTAYALQGLGHTTRVADTWDEAPRRQLVCATDRGLNRIYTGQLGHALSERTIPAPELRGALHLGSSGGRYRIDHVAHTLLAALHLTPIEPTTP